MSGYLNSLSGNRRKACAIRLPYSGFFVRRYSARAARRESKRLTVFKYKIQSRGIPLISRAEMARAARRESKRLTVFKYKILSATASYSVGNVLIR